MKIDRSSGHLGHHHTKMENRRGAPVEAAASTWVGRSGGPSRNGRQRRQLGGSVGRRYRVGNALYGFRGSVARDAECTFNFASPCRYKAGVSSRRVAAVGLQSPAAIARRPRARYAPSNGFCGSQSKAVRCAHTLARSSASRASGGSTSWPSDARRIAALPWALPTQGRDLRAPSPAPRPPASAPRWGAGNRVQPT